ncbi:RraA family protein [Nakamurella endophytica]|uniref:Putative 4-hydroxy-4-methyl-2-oxoglutarate aldolase n=1 Tax=Nakamurella endophytica TaxID=1748367 RepID=A0A917SV93_9ACTN|nr:RraA family protein [Nakamurella endophytica]GGL98068.1 demethylmenaquinone methyltransferase [Nakamurella endophytica]
MDPRTSSRLDALTTAHLTDACLRAGVPVRCAPAGTRAVEPGSRVAGRVLPARHAGSVDVFLEALAGALPGDVLVVDNGGRLDEACVGDLVVQEAASAGLAGLVLWGLHRDTADIRAIGLPVFSLGALPTGPLELRDRPDDALDRAGSGAWSVGTSDVVVADDDGAVFLPADRLPELLTLAERIRDTERRQADRIRSGESLRDQLRMTEFVERRNSEPGLTFRAHLREIGGAVEE